MRSTTALLREISTQDQAELAARYNGEHRRQFKSRWLVDTLTNRLPPEHVQLGRFLLGQQAIAEGRRPRDYDRVDTGANGMEGALLARLEATRLLTGYERAAFATLRRRGSLCFRAVIEGDSLSEMMTRCGFRRGFDRPACELVQLTMMAAHDYDEVRRKELETWRGR